MIPLAIPNLGAREAELVADCVSRGWISSGGNYVPAFEEAVRDAVGAQGAVAVSSGTTALHLSLRIAGIEHEEEVVMPSLTFIAPANAIRHHGAWPAFVDIDPDTWQLDPRALRAFLEDSCDKSGGQVRNRHTGRQVRGILPVHILGHPAPMRKLERIASEWGLFLVEDAAEALGARYSDGVGVGGKGRFVCFSFNGNKVVSTGGGGMLVTDDPDVARYGRFLSTQARSESDEYIHSVVGYNYRLTNIQAALGVAQMERLEGFIHRKEVIAGRYRAALGDGELGLGFMRPVPEVRCTWWLSTVILPEGVDRREVSAELAAEGIEARPLWQPLHLSPAMEGAYSAPCPEAERLYRRALSLPSSTGISDGEVDHVIGSLSRVLLG